MAASALQAFTAPRAEAVSAGDTEIVAFDKDSPLTDVSEAAPRELGPAAARLMRERLRKEGKTLGGQPLDVHQERFIVRMPRGGPSPGYGLVVFVPPWPDARLPSGWGPVLDEHGLIFVSAARSGNDDDILNRRMPLAVLAAENIKALYPIDPSRIYVAGFSGGSRVALRVALAYPDVFAGALLNSGSDEIGTAELPLPPAANLNRFQNSKIVYATGENDEINLNKDQASRSSLARFCSFDTEKVFIPHVGHEVLSQSAFSRAVERLDNPSRVDPQRLVKCRARLSPVLQDGG